MFSYYSSGHCLKIASNNTLHFMIQQIPSYLFQAGKLSDYEYPDNCYKYWMRITKELEYSNIFNPKITLNRRPFFWQHQRWGNSSRSHRFENVSGYLSFLMVWIMSKGDFNCIKIKSLNQDENWKEQIPVSYQCNEKKMIKK